MGPGSSLDNISLIRFVSGFVFLLVIAMVWRGRRSGYVSGTRMVLKHFHVSDDPAAEIGVQILGRASGIVSWLLTLLKLSPDVELTITRTEASMRSASLSGVVQIYIPLQKVTATVCGYERSILALGAAILSALWFVVALLSALFENNREEVSSDMAAVVAALVLAAAALLWYFLSKRIAIVLETTHKHGVVFKRSVIENVSVDLPEALRAIEIINARVLAAQGGRASLAAAAAAGTGAGSTVAVSSLKPGQCWTCGAVNPSATRFCENCGASLSS